VTVLRPPLWLRLLGAASFVFAAGVLVVGGLEEGGWLLVLCLIGAAAVVALTVRNWLLRVEAGQEVVIVNLFSTVRLPWAQVAYFGYDSGLWVRRRTGRQHDITAFGRALGALPSAERRGRAATAELEAICTRRRRR